MNSEGYCYYKHIWCKPKSYNGRCVCCSFINSASGLSSAFPCSTLLWRRLLACEVFFLGFFANCTFRGLVSNGKREASEVPIVFLPLCTFSHLCGFCKVVASPMCLHHGLAGSEVGLGVDTPEGEILHISNELKSQKRWFTCPKTR